MANREISDQFRIPVVTKVQELQTFNGMASGLSIPLRVFKPWGWEIWYANSSLYCFKAIWLDEGKRCSLHLHIDKHETLLVGQGVLQLELINQTTKEAFIVEVVAGNAWVVPPGTPHRLIGGSGGTLIYEASTEHFDEDSIKLG